MKLINKRFPPPLISPSPPLLSNNNGLHSFETVEEVTVCLGNPYSRAKIS